jgi:hypothetical protein
MQREAKSRRQIVREFRELKIDIENGFLVGSELFVPFITIKDNFSIESF